VQGAGGMRFHDPGYLRLLRSACAEHGVLLIFDEIATGFGRSGALFARARGRAPRRDVRGQGADRRYLTLAAALCTPEVAAGISDGELPVLAHGPTFMGNPLACAVASASLDVLLTGYPGGWQAQVRGSRRAARWLAPRVACPGHRRPGPRRDRGGPAGSRRGHQRGDQGGRGRGVWLRPFRDLVYTMPPT